MSQAGGFVPPPPREPQTPSGRKSNADFRKIMATPRRASSDSGAAPTSIAVPSTPDASMKPPAKKKQKKWRPPPEKKKEDSLYRDRAKERREGDNPDYLGVQTELASSGFQSVAPPSVGGTSEEERQRQIEHSKYLGGDMEHTHLVKGLDFALLNRIRSEIHKQKEEDKEAKEQAESSSSSTAATSQEKSEGPHFRGALGRNIHNFLFEDDIVDEEEEEEAAAKPKVAPNNPNKPLKQTDAKKKKLTRRELLSKRVAEAFLKGRTTYVFDAESKYSQSDIPTIMLRSKRDCPQRGERMVSNVPTEIVQQVSKIMEYLKPAHKSKKQKHSEKRKTVAELTQPTVELVNKMQDKGKEKEQERTSIMALAFIKPVAKQKQADAGISSLFEDLLGKAPAKRLDLDDDDIFPEVGSDYVCRPTKEQEEAAKRVLEQEQQAIAEQQQKAAEVDTMMLVTEEGKESRGHTIYEKEVAARTKAVQDNDLLGQDYFGTGPKKRKREEPVASQNWKQHGEEEDDDDDDEDEDDEDEDESDEEQKAEKEKMGDVQKPERSGEEGEQPMEGVEEGPVREQDAEGPQRPPESDYDVMMPSAGYMDSSDAYDMYPPPPPAGAEGEVYSSYPDTDAQYATAVAAYGYGAPLATMPPPPPPPLPPQQQAEHKPEGAVVVTKALSAQEQRDRGMATVFKRDDERLFSKNRKRDDREKNPTFVPDEYAECYPGAYESAFTKTVVDDDSDDEDLSKMDAGTKARKKIRPWHFETDEAWAKYNETLEATPKAAFQFGVKMTDGRKKGNLKKKKKSEDAKLNEQLQKINQFNAKKKDV